MSDRRVQAESRVRAHSPLRMAMVAGVAACAAVMSGCSESDSFLLDPSVLGRWEHTPTTVPILSRINSIESPADEWVEYSDVQPADLVPELSEYRIGPGDGLTVIVYDIPEEGRPFAYERLVDTRGFIELPQLGSINIGGQTVSGAEETLKAAMKDLVAHPLASVEVTKQHQQRFSIIGAVQNPGPFYIPTADYRLLEALSAAGGFSEALDTIYIIRQVPLTEAAAAGTPKASRGAEGAQPGEKPSPDKLIDIINELSTPEKKPGEQPKPANPGDAPKPAGSPGVFQPASGQPTASPTKPPIDLIEPGQAAPKPAPRVEAPPEPDTGDSTWVYLNGQWVKVKKPAAVAGQPAGAAKPEALIGQDTSAKAAVVTQRVIRVPTQRLANGDARVNLVIRPGDVIRVPPQPSGNIFIGGQVQRVGTYQMIDKLTLTNALIAAGGLNSIAVPERVDLTRMVGNDRVATIRLNLRAIAERTHPEVYLKPNDQINVGTNFWATPLAVIRNGFRFSYGFGFILDRNFADDIWGYPPNYNNR